MKISVIGLGMYSLAISKMLAKKENNKIMIWTENNAKYEEYKKMKAHIELLELLAEAEADVKNKRMAPISETFDDLLNMLQG